MSLEVSHLSVSYFTQKGELRAVRDASFSLAKRETLGLVGESGCGKTTLGFALARLVPRPGKVVRGSVKLDGKEILTLGDKELRKIRGREIAMVFQDPTTSLNPVKRVKDHFVEAIRAHQPETSKEEAVAKCRQILSDLGVPEDRMKDYPHQLSGGLKQRVMIGLALALDPKVLVADEPTTSLDVIIEAQILDLIGRLKAKTDLSMLLVTHNLGVVAEVADRIAIMYAGEIMELADARTIFRSPLFPYTQLLLKLVPNIEAESASLESIPGSPPDLTKPRVGCQFVPRCPFAFARCRVEAPVLTEVEPGHLVACHLYAGKEK
ncbi:MAG: ABC transporter ATP-binding protein [Thaumarchaeota archaeon]|nr:ABC transporter ATP-binding protein [Nitrososphaerota archaeon]